MRHILKPLVRHPSMPLLVAMQVALACAITCNALFLLQQKLAPLMAPDGVGEPGRLVVVSGLRARGEPWKPARLRAVEAELRQLPGVTAASYAATFPMIGYGQMLANVQRPQGKATASTSIYVGDNLLRTLGLHLVAGRNFTATEQHTILGSGMGFHVSGPVIITQALADRLFHGGQALGRTLTFQYATHSRRTVVGIVSHLMRNQLGGDNRADLDDSMLFPGMPQQWPAPLFAVRARHADAPRLHKSIKAVIQRELGHELLPGTHPSVDMFATLRHRMLAAATAAVWLFTGVTVIVLIVTLVGIMGMTGYWVRQRTKQIGIRRALGARRHDIFRAFQIENLLVVGTGTVLGMVTAYLTNGWLMQHDALSRLPLAYLPVGVALFLILGQIAVLVPAHRATGIAPIVATRAI